MAINRVDYPANLTDQDDFSAHGELIETRFTDQVNAPQWVVSGNIPQGVVLQIGGVVYRADSDTAITGTASDYVQVTPSGATASAAYVANLSGVSWSAQYNGYYDASENLYLFDEGKALSAGQISSVFGRYLMQQPNGDVAVGRNLTAEGDVSAGGTLSADNYAPIKKPIGVFRGTSLTVGALFTALAPSIPNNGDTIIVSGAYVTDLGISISLNIPSHAERVSSTQITLYVLLSTIFDPNRTSDSNSGLLVSATINDGSTATLGGQVTLVW